MSNRKYNNGIRLWEAAFDQFISSFFTYNLSLLTHPEQAPLGRVSGPIIPDTHQKDSCGTCPLDHTAFSISRTHQNEGRPF